jgi:hypothetical protein
METRKFEHNGKEYILSARRFENHWEAAVFHKERKLWGGNIPRSRDTAHDFSVFHPGATDDTPFDFLQGQISEGRIDPEE